MIAKAAAGAGAPVDSDLQHRAAGPADLDGIAAREPAVELVGGDQRVWGRRARHLW